MHNLVKYKNRKIYSKTTKSYVNLDYIANLIKTKTPFTVTSKESGDNRNITTEIKATAIGELLKSDAELLNKVSSLIGNEVNNEQTTITPQA